MHAVDHLLVDKNVAFNILGHAYFLEDGIEQGTGSHNHRIILVYLCVDPAVSSMWTSLQQPSGQ